MKKKRGRPKKPKGERRSKPLRVLLTDDERATIDTTAESRGMESSTWARMVLLKEARGDLP